MHFRTSSRIAMFCCAFSALLVVGSRSDNRAAEVADRSKVSGVHGGLCVIVGVEELPLAQEFARTERFLVQVLEEDAKAVDEARKQLRKLGLYGLISVSRLPADGTLPYSDDLVNLVIVGSRPGKKVTVQEIQRVLCPLGVAFCDEQIISSESLAEAGVPRVLELSADRRLYMARKPRPKGMDHWTHARHSAAGNAVSRDSLVGPPRRIRWVVNAQSEVAGLVTAAGRNFYASALARDSFNGLRLWARDLIQPSAKGDFVMKRVPSSVPMPVADDQYLFAVTAGKLVSVNAATGETVREFTDAGKPRILLHDAGMLVVADEKSVRALDVESGRLEWDYQANAPRNLVAGDEFVALIQGDARRGDKIAVVMLDKSTGKIRWKRDDFEWATRVYRTVYYQGLLVCEVSTLNDDGPGNAMYVISASDGELRWDLDFLPGMNHTRQARAMFVGDLLWILHGGKDAEKKKLPIQCSALKPETGEFLVTHDAGLTHCFPPVATPRYLLAGELDLTDLNTGEVDANHITKAACGRESGWVPANGLIYVTPKHCTCWPMLRGYAALAPERPEGGVGEMKLEEIDFVLEKGVDPPGDTAIAATVDDWPCYRHDAWRSGSTPEPGPAQLDTLWQTDFGASSAGGPIVADWRENPYVKGPVTSPVIGDGVVVVARPDVHEVVAMDASSGDVRWRFCAEGRVDTPPTIHRGLCLFGDKRGWVYCLRTADGELVWKRRAAPVDEQIVAYGQLESPWPVPGSILIVDDVAYFAAGRQSLADGGILFFAVEPATGAMQWVQRLDTVPQQGFYENSGLEFDNFDLLHREGDHVAMSRWIFSRDGKQMSVDKWNAFAKLNTGQGASVVPRGCWSYAPRHQRRIPSYTHRRPLLAFRDNVLVGCLQGGKTIYRREFTEEEVAKFDTKWMTGWAAGQISQKGEMPWRSHRLAEGAKWQVDVFEAPSRDQIGAMTLAADRLYLVGSSGELRVHSALDGKLLDKRPLAATTWDGLAVAGGRLYVSTTDGKVLCLGEK
ncbi:MAG: PQQ-binding-like beta-propeller repeat protein [Pirellulaceae bacterium]